MGILDMLEMEIKESKKEVKECVSEKAIKEDAANTVVSNTIPLKIKLTREAECPKYAHDGDSGFDIAAAATVKFDKFQTRLVPTGLYVEVPKGYELQIRPRSGYSLKTNLRVANSPGTIDSNYRGEVGIIIQNVGNKQVVINKGTRIAQGVLVPVMKAEFEVVEELSNTNRGADGFGSTDKGGK
jgi:dUTP pyrophosphatase